MGIQIFCSLAKNSLYRCSLYRGATVLMGHASNVVSLLSLNLNNNNNNKSVNDFVSSETTASQSLIRVWQKLHLNSYFRLSTIDQVVLLEA